MAGVNAAALRNRAREAMLAGGGRGFMRFAPPGGALLATDALRRCEDEAQRLCLIGALEAAGFACGESGGLLLLTPCDAILRCTERRAGPIDWSDPLCKQTALAARWLRERPRDFTPAGRRLVLETLRLTWQPKDQVLLGLDALRAQAAAMLRTGDRSGLHEAGCILDDWCREE